jgi:folylpolyglutamate synthase/dihydropteroate synthase
MIFVAADHPRSASAASLAALARRLSIGEGVLVEAAATPAEALRMAVADPQTTTVCIAGSLFLIGEILAQATENTDIFSRGVAPG